MEVPEPHQGEADQVAAATSAVTQRPVFTHHVIIIINIIITSVVRGAKKSSTGGLKTLENESVATAFWFFWLFSELTEGAE